MMAVFRVQLAICVSQSPDTKYNRLISASISKYLYLSKVCGETYTLESGYAFSRATAAVLSRSTDRTENRSWRVDFTHVITPLIQITKCWQEFKLTVSCN